MSYVSEIQPVLHSVLHGWHWHKREYLMASSTFMSFMAICFSLRSSKKASQISIRAQILSLSEKYIDSMPKIFSIQGEFPLTPYNADVVRNFYSKLVTFVQTVDSSGLNHKNRQSIKEQFWLQCTAIHWDEIAKGEGYSCSMGKKDEVDCMNTLSGHRRTVCKSFKKIIRKHKGKEFPVNIPPK